MLDQGLERHEATPSGMVVCATPERAILELCDEASDASGAYEADALMQGMATLRPQRLEMLLCRCRSMKAKRRQLSSEGDHRLKGSRYFWLVNAENLGERFQDAFAALKHSDLKISRAWAIKELFRDFWGYRTRGRGRRHFNKWYSWAIRSRLTPIKKVARMLKRHLANLLNYFKHPITNTASEGMNSRIQTVKSNARGFRLFQGYRTSTLFCCGGLDMAPVASH